MTWLVAAKLIGSLVAILALAGISRWLGLGGDVRIRDEAEARRLADEAVCGFAAVDVALDRDFLTIGTGEKTFGSVTLQLGAAAQVWAAGLRHLSHV